MLDNKPAWKSKTLLMTAFTAVMPFIPGLGEWVAAHTELYSCGVAFAFAVLRFVTKDKLGIR